MEVTLNILPIHLPKMVLEIKKKGKKQKKHWIEIHSWLVCNYDNFHINPQLELIIIIASMWANDWLRHCTQL